MKFDGEYVSIITANGITTTLGILNPRSLRILIFKVLEFLCVFLDWARVYIDELSMSMIFVEWLHSK